MIAIDDKLSFHKDNDGRSNFWIKAILYFLICLIVFFIFYALNLILVPIIVGFLFAFILLPVIEQLEGRNIHRTFAIAFVFFIMLVGLVLVVFDVVPRIANEFTDFSINKEKYQEIVVNKYFNVRETIESSFPGTVPWKEVEIYVASQTAKLSASWLTKLPMLVASSLEKIILSIVLVPLVAFFVLKDGPTLKRWLIGFVPNRYFELALEVIHSVNAQTGAFIRGQLIDCIINAFIISILLYLIGMPYYLFLGIFAGLANAIPFIGPLTAGIIGVIIALLTGDVSPWPVVLVFLTVHLVDVFLIYPKVVGHSLELHELVVVVGIILGGHIGGIIGMLLIIPIVGILFKATRVMYRLLKGHNII